MLVRFKHLWFSPGQRVRLNKLQSRSGKRYKGGPGWQHVPDEYRSLLPKSATVKDEVVEESPVEDDTVTEIPGNVADDNSVNDRLAQVAADEELAEKRRQHEADLVEEQKEADAQAEADAEPKPKAKGRKTKKGSK